jgi:hypothetical protein
VVLELFVAEHTPNPAASKYAISASKKNLQEQKKQFLENARSVFKVEKADKTYKDES